jgi:hypothetical protein
MALANEWAQFAPAREANCEPATFLRPPEAYDTNIPCVIFLDFACSRIRASGVLLFLRDANEGAEAGSQEMRPWRRSTAASLTAVTGRLRARAIPIHQGMPILSDTYPIARIAGKSMEMTIRRSQTFVNEPSRIASNVSFVAALLTCGPTYQSSDRGSMENVRPKQKGRGSAVNISPFLSWLK